MLSWTIPDANVDVINEISCPRSSIKWESRTYLGIGQCLLGVRAEADRGCREENEDWRKRGKIFGRIKSDKTVVEDAIWITFPPVEHTQSSGFLLKKVFASHFQMKIFLSSLFWKKWLLHLFSIEKTICPNYVLPQSSGRPKSFRPRINKISFRIKSWRLWIIYTNFLNIIFL